ncbi:hypothetical protein D3C72_812520 [compost metagenome]
MKIGDFDRPAAPFVIIQEGGQEARGPVHAGIGVSENRQVEDRHAADAEDGVAIQDGAQILVLNRLVGLDRNAGLLGAVDVADRAGREDDAVQLADVLRAANGGRRHQAGAVGEAHGQVGGHAGLEVGIQFNAAGVNHRAVGRGQFGMTGGGSDAAFQIIGDSFGADAVVTRPGIDAVVGRPAGGHDIAFTAGGVGVHIETAGRQAVWAGCVGGLEGGGWNRGRRRSRRSFLGQRGQGRHARDHGCTSQEPGAQGSLSGCAAITHAESTHCRATGNRPISRLRYRTAR